jgi:signal transduction histidine kinase
VIVNLCSNAIQAMPRGGHLHVGLERSGDSLILSVEDTGVGMTEEVQRRLFTPFFTTKEVGEGSGLGLSVVHGIVTAHGGTVHVSSSPGVGTTVTVTLPAEAAKP